MEQPNGNPCPECGTPRRPDNTPACACTQRASEALRDARTAQAAAAEDFDPLRIRPYVELDGHGEALRPEATADATTSPGPKAPGSDSAPAVGPGMPLHAEGSPAEGAPQPASPVDATMSLRAVAPDTTSVPPRPLAPPAAEPSVTDLRLFGGTGPDRGTPGPAGPGGRPRRRRRTVLVAAAGACVAVVAAAGYASGLFSYQTPSRDTALPDDVRASVPDAPSSSPASTPPTTSAPAAPPVSAPPPPLPSTSGSPSPSPSPSASSVSPTPSKPADSSPPPATTPATGAENAPEDNARQGGTTVLRRGDRGPEVTELQLRLRQLYLYNDDTDGNFDDQVEEALRNYQWSRGIRDDDLGVYGRETRTSLESETNEP